MYVSMHVNWYCVVPRLLGGQEALDILLIAAAANLFVRNQPRVKLTIMQTVCRWKTTSCLVVLIASIP